MSRMSRHGSEGARQERKGTAAGCDDKAASSKPAQVLQERSLACKVGVASAAFVTSILLMNGTKLIFEQPDKFRYPLFITALHQVMAFWFVTVFLRRRERRKRSLSASDCSPKAQHVKRNVEDSESYWSHASSIVKAAGPVAVLGTITVACGNTALLHIYPSLHEMIQNTGPFWQILIGKLSGRSIYNWWTYISLIPILIGGLLCVSGEIGSFSMTGIFISTMAVVTRGLRLFAQERVFRGTSAPEPVVQPETVGRRDGTSEAQADDETYRFISVEKDPSLQEKRALAAKPTQESSSPKMDSLTLLYYTLPFNFCLYLLYSALYENCFSLLYAGDGKVYLFLTGQMGRSTYFYVFLTGFLASTFNILAFLQVELVGGFISSLISQLKTPTFILTSYIIFGAPFTMQQSGGVALVFFGLYLNKRYAEEIRPAKIGDST